MLASLAPACCSVSKLVRHALRSSRAPIYGYLGRRMAGVLGRSWNSERPLVFAHVVLTKTLGVCQAREIRERITQRMDLWERGQYAGLVGDAKAEGSAREVRAASGGKEEDEAIARSCHDTLLSGKLRQAVRWATNREGG